MRVTVDFEEEDIQPLIQAHLETGKSVKAEVENALKFYNSCKALQASGKDIAVGTVSREYFNNFTVLLKGNKTA